MILEGIVTTLNAEGVLNVAPMGPRVAAEDLSRFVLRPFQSSTTYRNLKATGEGVLHVTDDALLLARTAIGLEVDPPTRAAEVVRGRVLTGACRFYEFRVARLDDAEERTTIEVDTVAMGRLRDFFGWNRAKHAVLEGAILATRLGILPIEEIVEGFERLIEPVRRTSGPAEAEAFELLRSYVEQAAKREGLSLGGSPT